MLRKSPFDDLEVAAYLDAQPRYLTIPELTLLCREHFGPARAWSRGSIARHWNRTHPFPKARPSLIERDDELRVFIDEKIDAIGPAEIRAACREQFGKARTPGRVTLRNYIARFRREQLLAPLVKIFDAQQNRPKRDSNARDDR